MKDKLTLIQLAESTEMPKALCLNCKQMMNQASHRDKAVIPSPGDFTVCLYCGHLMAFDERMLLRELTAEELTLVKADKELRAQIEPLQKAFRGAKQAFAFDMRKPRKPQ